MKTHILTLTGISALLGSALLATSCIENNPGTDLLIPVETYKVETENYTFLSDPEKYKETNTSRMDSESCSFTWSIEKVTRSENILTLDVSRPLSCEVSYELIWDGAIMESYPMMANIYLHALSEGCEDEDELTADVLVINLEETFKNLSGSSLAEINFNIREVCTLKDIQCMDDCDVTVSN